MSTRNQISREQAIEIARRCAKAKPQSYYAEPFQPHEWVIDSIMEAANRDVTGCAVCGEPTLAGRTYCSEICESDATPSSSPVTRRAEPT